MQHERGAGFGVRLYACAAPPHGVFACFCETGRATLATGFFFFETGVFGAAAVVEGVDDRVGKGFVGFGVTDRLCGFAYCVGHSS